MVFFTITPDCWQTSHILWQLLGWAGSFNAVLLVSWGVLTCRLIQSVQAQSRPGLSRISWILLTFWCSAVSFREAVRSRTLRVSRKPYLRPYATLKLLDAHAKRQSVLSFQSELCFLANLQRDRRCFRHHWMFSCSVLSAAIYAQSLRLTVIEEVTPFSIASPAKSPQNHFISYFFITSVIHWSMPLHSLCINS